MRFDTCSLWLYGKVEGMDSTVRKTGFTIVELLIVIVVIAILAAVTIVAYNGISKRAKTAAQQSEIQSASRKIEAAKVTNPADAYPATLQEAEVNPKTSSLLIYKPYTAKIYCLASVLDTSEISIRSDQPDQQNTLCSTMTTTSAITKDSRNNYYLLNYDAGTYIPALSGYYKDVQLVKYDSNMKPIWVRGSNGKGDGQLDSSYSPWGVYVDPENNVWVADTGNHRFQKFDSNGNYILKIGGPSAGSAVGSFNTAYGMAFTNTGHAWISDRYNNRILKYTLDGTFVQAITNATGAVLNQPHSLAVDADQNLYAVSRNNNRVQKYSPTGNLIATFGTGVYGSGPGQLSSPTTMLLDPVNGDVYVYEIDTRRISVFSADGTFLRNFTTLVGPITYNRTFSMVWEGDNITMAIQNMVPYRIQTITKTGQHVKTVGDDMLRI